MTTSETLPSVAALNLEFDAERMAAEIRALRDEPWRRNRIVSSDGIGHEIMDDWKMFILRGPNGDVQRTDPGGAGLASHADTSLLKRLPYHAKVLASIPAPLFSARLIGLGPGAKLHEHRDGKWGFRWGVMRLHIPVITNPGASLVVQGEEFHWDEGRTWYADFDRPHYAQNLGTERRIHLVVDCMPTPELLALFPTEFKNRLPWTEVLFARAEVPLPPDELASFESRFPMPATFPEWSDEPVLDPEENLDAGVELSEGRLVLRVADKPLFGLVHVGSGEFQLEGWTAERSIHIDRSGPEPTVRFRIREGSTYQETVRPMAVSTV
ncbi:aspartyl/asparaginyl beta-hydroxylase domain-containing protein [Streptomyces sp. NPDC127066]|uniref:aspartyl/asparaginyl beta-hydroxylase domain-containing protein n=1 Tax=Streptomyces sp. NPDC127066 TaxID=3347125 RepID=UPI0036617213